MARSTKNAPALVRLVKAQERAIMQPGLYFSGTTVIRGRGEHIESLLKRFRGVCERAGTLGEMKERKYFISKAENEKGLSYSVYERPHRFLSAVAYIFQ